MRLWTYRVAAALLAALLAACGGAPAAPPTPTPTADARAIIDESRGAMLALTNYQATIAMTLSGEGGGDVTMQVAVRGSPVAPETADQPLRFRGEVTQSTLPALPQGTIAVLGSENVLYDPVQKVALRGGPQVGGSELFNLFLGSQIRVVSLLQPELADARLVGDERVGGYETVRVELTPRAEVAAAALFGEGSQGTVWIDKATSLPVQFDYTDSGVGLRWTASDVDITSEVTDEQLGFTLPAGARAVSDGDLGETVVVGTTAEAAERAGFTPLTPDYLPSGLPAEPTRIGVQETPLGALVTLSYGVQTDVAESPRFDGIEDIAGRTSSGITIQALGGAAALPLNLPTSAVVSEVQVRGSTAIQAVLSEGQAILTWKEGDVFYTIRSNGYGIDEILRVAESMQ